MIDYQQLGQSIASHRKKKQITQERLAEYLNVSTTFISKIERGKTQISLERLVQIGRYLDISPTELLYGNQPDASYLRTELSSLLEQCPEETLPLIRSLIQDVVQHHKSAQKNADL
ncbi:MAG: helix-turn-helix transcriptional regulator [Lachnospiraceae bacterium]|jgi:transcriptional regulator with XRE-family HTH domain|nr:helix-turn-helix transcriptional regulator [Lachnospiraceae bacterium]MCI8957553.1 helix-turn-helix transcriptional regulator [Lachnospiraceae bacterium]